MSGRESLAGPTHADTLDSLSNLARVQLERSEVDAALQLYERARDRLAQSANATGELFFRIRNGLARAYFAKGRTAEALELLRQLEAQVRQGPSDAVSARARLLAELGGTQLEGSQWAEAERILREAIGLLERSERPSWYLDDARSMLGATLLGQEKFAAAEPLLLEAYEGLKQRESEIPRPLPTALERALQRIVALYEQTGADTSLQRWRTELDRATQAAASLRASIRP